MSRKTRKRYDKILYKYYRYFSSNAQREKYNNRCQAHGYDMICTIIKRLISLYKQNKICHQVMIYWLPFIKRSFIDHFHLRNHVDALCKDPTSLFNPKNPKFNFHKSINTQITEQGWLLNRYHLLKIRIKFFFYFYIKIS